MDFTPGYDLHVLTALPCWTKEWGLPVFFCLHWDVVPSTSRRKSLGYGIKSSFKSMECTFQSIVRTFKSIERAFKSLEWRICRASLAFSSHSTQKRTVRSKEFHRYLPADCLSIDGEGFPYRKVSHPWRK